jgi:hypothetical protein
MNFQRRFPMNNFRFAFRILVFALFALTTSALVNAQATRTWVSGVGDDANPCSRTAPCKTFAGAISKTATGGEIDALDPGGYGTLTITKSITIDGGTGAGWGSVLASGTTGFIINAAGATVTLRHLSVNGTNKATSPGVKGVNVLAASVVNIEYCSIFGFSQEGILVNISTGADVRVRDSNIVDCGSAGGATGAGIRANTSGTGTNTLFLSIVNSSFDHNTEGIRAESNVRATVNNSTASHNTLNGFVLIPGATASEMNLESSVSANNRQWGVFSGTGGTVRISNMTVTNNLVLGLNPSGGAILSYGNNKIQGNGPGGAGNGSPTGPAPQA